MLHLVFDRARRTVIVLFAVTLLTFLLARVTGDPTTLLLPPDAPKEMEIELREELGLDKPLYVQYGLLIGNVIQGDLGESYVSERSVSQIIFERFPATLELAGAGIALTFSIGIPLGILAALNRGRAPDVLVRLCAAISQATPSFWLALLLILVFGVWLEWVPFYGRRSATNLILPTIALSAFPLAGVIRFVRSGMLEVMSQDYILVARGKGLPERIVVLRHGLRSALIPVVAFSGIVIIANFLTGSLVVEVIFAWPGVGFLAFESVVRRDFPTLNGLVLIFACMYALGNFAVDIAYGYLDPLTRRN